MAHHHRRRAADPRAVPRRARRIPGALRRSPRARDRRAHHARAADRGGRRGAPGRDTGPPPGPGRAPRALRGGPGGGRHLPSGLPGRLRPPRLRGAGGPHRGGGRATRAARPVARLPVPPARDRRPRRRAGVAGPGALGPGLVSRCLRGGPARPVRARPGRGVAPCRRPSLRRRRPRPGSLCGRLRHDRRARPGGVPRPLRPSRRDRRRRRGLRRGRELPAAVLGERRGTVVACPVRRRGSRPSCPAGRPGRRGGRGHHLAESGAGPEPAAPGGAEQAPRALQRPSPWGGLPVDGGRGE